ncbi:MAG: GNAT family N-acetyltransferase [Clostridia bacterium]|nr:GNAT family N-acetyltransferase [Clostridia bacterium]
MEKIIRLTKAHHKDFLNINKVIRETITNSSWFMPISIDHLENTFDANSTLVVYGAEVDGKIACVSTYDTDKEECCELTRALGIESDKVAEIGYSMTLPEYRGQNLMQKVNLALIEIAKEQGIEYLVATAHPDNIASNKSLAKIGMECKTQIIRAGKYLRNVYMIKL